MAKVSASLKHLDEKAKYLTKHSAGCDAHDSNKHTPKVLEHPDKKYTKATISVTTIANELQKDAKPMQVCLKCFAIMIAHNTIGLHLIVFFFSHIQ